MPVGTDNEQIQNISDPKENQIIGNENEADQVLNENPDIAVAPFDPEDEDHSSDDTVTNSRDGVELEDGLEAIFQRATPQSNSIPDSTESIHVHDFQTNPVHDMSDTNVEGTLSELPDYFLNGDFASELQDIIFNTNFDTDTLSIMVEHLSGFLNDVSGIDGENLSLSDSGSVQSALDTEGVQNNGNDFSVLDNKDFSSDRADSGDSAITRDDVSSSLLASIDEPSALTETLSDLIQTISEGDLSINDFVNGFVDSLSSQLEYENAVQNEQDSVDNEATDYDDSNEFYTVDNNPEDNVDHGIEAIIADSSTNDIEFQVGYFTVDPVLQEISFTPTDAVDGPIENTYPDAYNDLSNDGADMAKDILYNVEQPFSAITDAVINDNPDIAMGDPAITSIITDNLDVINSMVEGSVGIDEGLNMIDTFIETAPVDTGFEVTMDDSINTVNPLDNDMNTPDISIPDPIDQPDMSNQVDITSNPTDSMTNNDFATDQDLSDISQPSHDFQNDLEQLNQGIEANSGFDINEIDQQNQRDQMDQMERNQEQMNQMEMNENQNHMLDYDSYYNDIDAG